MRKEQDKKFNQVTLEVPLYLKSNTNNFRVKATESIEDASKHCEASFEYDIDVESKENLFRKWT
jgi:hypothetical protein